MCIDESNEIGVVFQFYQNQHIENEEEENKKKFNKRTSTTKFAVKAFPLVYWKRAKDD